MNAAALITERFGEYDEKTFMDISTVEEAFDWMQGPLLEGVYPQQSYTCAAHGWTKEEKPSGATPAKQRCVRLA